MLTLLLGGARSGKSALAVDLARRSGAPVTFVATAQAGHAETDGDAETGGGDETDGDAERAGRDEMARRIERHKAERPSSWITLEAPLELEAAVRSVSRDRVVIVDCLSLWLANLLASDHDVTSIETAATSCATAVAGRPGAVIAVSNEVGSGIVPVSALARSYRDLLGRVNACFAERAADAYLVVAGRALALQRTETLRAAGESGAFR